MMSGLFSIRFLVVLLVAMVFAATTYGLAASNTISTTQAGNGSGAITGYAMSNVRYTLNSTDPRNIDAVSFTLSAPAATVKVQLDSTSGVWYDCTMSNGTDVACATTNPQVTWGPAISTLQVIAAQ